MKTFFKIAWRNILRNKRRSIITIAAITVGLAILIHVNGLNDGFNEQMVNNIVKLHIGHIQIHHKGFHNEMTIEKYIDNDEIKKIVQVIQSNEITPYIKTYVKRIKFHGLISSPTNSYGILIIGVSLEKEANMTTIKKTIIYGDYFDSSKNTSNIILIGDKLAKNLKVKLGEKIVIMSQAFDGSIGACAFRIKGIFKTGNPDMDKSVVYIPIESAQRLLVYGDKISEIAILVNKSNDMEVVKQWLESKLNTQKLEILTWKDISPDMVQIMQINKINIYIAMGIIFILVGMGILNTLLMSIFERFKEIGIMMAIGMKPIQVVIMIIFESLILGFLGILGGVCIGLVDIWYLGTYGFDFSAFSEGLAKFLGIETTVYSILTLKGILLPVLFVILSSISASLYPAIKAAKLEPVEAIRHI